MATSYVKTILGTAGLVSLWELGEASGAALDLKGTNPGTYNGSIGRGDLSILPGGEAKSALFVPTTSVVEVPDANSLDLGDTFSIEAWIRPNSVTAARGIISKGNGAYYLRVGETGKPELLRSQVAGIVASTVALSKESVYYVLATKTGATVKLYLAKAGEAELKDVTGTVTNSTCVNNAQALNIGGDTGFATERFDGRIQYAAVYNTALTKTVGNEHFLAGSAEAKKAKGTVAGTGTLAAKGKRTRRGKGTVLGTGTLAAKGKRTRRGKGTVAGTGTLAATAVKPERNRLRVREMVPMRQSLLFIAPNGKPYSFGEDSPTADGVIEDLNDSGSVPGGSKSLTAEIGRKQGVDYGDMKRGTRIQVYGVGARPIREYRLERAPIVSGDKLVISPSAAGYEAALIDDNSAQAIFLDADMSTWGEASARRRAEVTTNKYTNAQVQLLPAGSPDPENPESFSRVPAISHSWTTYNNLTSGDVAESWYDSLGIELGEILLDFAAVKGITEGVANWNDQVYTSIDGVALQELLADFDAKKQTFKRLEVAAGRFYLLLRDFFGEAKNEAVNWETQWKNVRVRDRSNLPLYGSWPAVGVLASDVAAYALRKWAPQIHFSTGPYGSIRPTIFPIPHLAFKAPTTVAEMIQQATRFELPEWGVWSGPEGPTFYMNRRGQREGAKRWRVRAHEADFEDTGQQMDLVFNGVIVQGQAADGSTLLIGPSGSGLRWTTPRLLDTDPTNPANELGIKRFAKIQMKGIATIGGMIEAGEAFLEQTRLLDASGKMTLTGLVEDEHGIRWPYYYVEEGHEVECMGSSIPGYRYIVNADRTRSTRSVSIDIDAPPDGFEAMMERLYAEYIGIGLESGG